MSKDTPTEIKLIPGQRVELDPKELRPGEALAQLAPLQKDDATVKKISDSIAEFGRIFETIKITVDGRYHDGRKRIAAANLQQLKTVPCEVVEDAEAAAIIVTSLDCRAHQTIGQRAYDLVPALEYAFQDAWAKRMANLGNKTVEKNSVFFGEEKAAFNELEKWAEELKMSVVTLRQARKVRQYFADKTKRDMTDKDEGVTEKQVTFEKFYLKRLFRADKPYGLGGIIAGIEFILQSEAGKIKKTGGAPKEPSKQAKVFKRAFADLSVKYKYWERFDDTQKEEVFKPFDTSLAKMPDDLLESMEKKLRDEKRRRSAAKESK